MNKHNILITEYTNQGTTTYNFNYTDSIKDSLLSLKDGYTIHSTHYRSDAKEFTTKYCVPFNNLRNMRILLNGENPHKYDELKGGLFTMYHWDGTIEYDKSISYYISKFGMNSTRLKDHLIQGSNAKKSVRGWTCNSENQFTMKFKDSPRNYNHNTLGFAYEYEADMVKVYGPTFLLNGWKEA